MARSTLHITGEALDALVNYARVEIKRQGRGIVLRGTYDFNEHTSTLSVREGAKVGGKAVGTVTIPAENTAKLGLRGCYTIEPSNVDTGKGALFYRLVKAEDGKGDVRAYQKK